MKIYFAIIESNGTAHTSVCTGTPVELFKQLLISGCTGEFDLFNQRTDRPKSMVNQFFVDHGLVDSNINEVLHFFWHGAADEGSQLQDEILDLLSYEMTNNAADFLDTLHKLFNGEIEDLSEMTEDQTLLMVMMSL